jgi:RNA polymerase primary sigma factor
VPLQEPSQPVPSHLNEGSGCASNPTPPAISPVAQKPVILFKREKRPTRQARTPRAHRDHPTTSEDEQPPALEDSPLYDEQHIRMRYFAEVSRHPLLTPQQEITAAEKRDAGNKAIRQLVSGSFLTRAQGMKLETDVLARDAAVRELEEGNLRLVITIATKFQGRGLELSDLIQEGNIGLMRAVDKFDGHRGLKFSTHAVWWIRRAIARAVDEKSRMVRIPGYINERLHEARKKQRGECSKNHQHSSQREKADKQNIHNEVERLMALAYQETLSLDAPLEAGQQRSRSLSETLPAPQPDNDEEIFTQHRSEKIGNALSALPSREAKILRLRFGFDGEKERGLQEIGDEFGISHERVRQLLSQAFNRLKQSEVIHELQEDH